VCMIYYNDHVLINTSLYLGYDQGANYILIWTDANKVLEH
jgi:hypothetical protein